MFEINNIQLVGRLAGVHFPGRAIGFKAPAAIEAKTPSAHGWFVLRMFELAPKGQLFEHGLGFRFEDVFLMCSYANSGPVESMRLNSLVSVQAQLEHFQLSENETVSIAVLTSEPVVLAEPVKPFGPYASPLGLRFYGKDGYEIKLTPDGKNPEKITRIGDMPAPRIRAMGAAKNSMSKAQIANAVERSEARQILAKQMKKQQAKEKKQALVVPSSSDQTSLFDQAPVINVKNDPNHRPGDKGFMDKGLVEALVDTKDFPI